MSRTATLSRSARREEVRRKARQRKAITLSILVVGLTLVVWGIYTYTADRQTDQAAMAYTAYQPGLHHLRLYDGRNFGQRHPDRQGGRSDADF